jgi:stringent starvation protein B
VGWRAPGDGRGTLKDARLVVARDWFLWRREARGGRSGNPVTTTGLPPKKDVILALLERSSVFIHLDPRHPDVRVPPWFKKQPQLVLQVGLNLAVRIPDLDIGDEAVSCTLSFNRSPFFCYVPWSAVFGLMGEDGKGMLWPKDIPPEVAAQQAERTQKEKAREHVRPVPATAPDEPAETSAASAADATRAERTQNAGAGKTKPSDKSPTNAASTASATSAKKRERSRLRAEKSSSQEPTKPRESERQPPAGESKRQLPPYLRVVK